MVEFFFLSAAAILFVLAYICIQCIFSGTSADVEAFAV